MCNIDTMHGRGRCGKHRGPGRRRAQRWVTDIPDVEFFKPAGIPLRELQVMEISIEELEAIRLTDLEGLTQEEAAAKMGISRRTFWNDLNEARKKIALALVNGNAIHIKGGDYTIAGEEKENQGDE